MVNQGASTTFISLSLEAENLWSRCWQICVWWESTSWLADSCLLLISSCDRERDPRSPPLSFFIRALMPFSLHPHDLITSQRPRFQIPSHWRLVFNIWILGFPGGTSDKESACQWRRWKRSSFDPWARKIPWRRKWQQTPIVLPGKFHGQRTLVGYHPRDHKESDMTEIMSIWILRGNKYSVHSYWELPQSPRVDKDVSEVSWMAFRVLISCSTSATANKPHCH